MPNEWLLQKFKKKKKKKEREKRTKKCDRKKKKKWKKKENDGQYEHFLFLFQWLLSLGLTHVFLLYYFVEIVLLKILLLSSTWEGAAQ